MRKTAVAVLVATLAMPAVARAQTQEPEWRVVNPYQAEVIPLYQGQRNPFPMLEPPPEKKAEETPVVTDETQKALVAAQEAAMAAVNAPTALLPQVDRTRVTAYVNGQNGAMVLINSQWRRVGQSVQVANAHNPEALAKIEELRPLDEVMAESLRQKLNDRLRAQPVANVEVVNITSTEVTLRSGQATLTRTISQDSW